MECFRFCSMVAYARITIGIENTIKNNANIFDTINYSKNTCYYIGHKTFEGSACACAVQRPLAAPSACRRKRAWGAQLLQQTLILINVQEPKTP